MSDPNDALWIDLLRRKLDASEAELAEERRVSEALRAENVALRVENSQLHGRNVELCRAAAEQEDET